MNTNTIRKMEFQLAKTAKVEPSSVKLLFYSSSDDVCLIHRESFSPTPEYIKTQADISIELQKYGKYITAVLNGPEVCDEQFETILRKKS